MEHRLKDEIKKFADLDELSRSAAKNIFEEMKKAVARDGRFSIALSGGHTPAALYHILATVYYDLINWDLTHVYFGDERFVSHADPRSNFKMAKDVLLSLIPLPEGNIHPIPTDRFGPEESAIEYEQILRKAFAGNTAFDVVLLGMGVEGHTASLFPESPALDENKRWVVAVDVPVLPSKRITLTFDILNRSRATFILVAGKDKADTIRGVIGTDADYHTFPVKGIRPSSGRLNWYLDAEAASLL